MEAGLAPRRYYDDNKRMACQFGWFYCILDKTKRGQPLSSKQINQNKKFSKKRCKVEHCFA